MPRIQIRDILVETDTLEECLQLLDKAIQYSKILDTNPEILVQCSSCGSYDLHAHSPTVLHCHNCGAYLELSNE